MKEKIKKVYYLLIFAGVLIPLFSFAQSFDRDLYFGLRNDSDVSKLQEFLTTEGLYFGPITGNFFSLTLDGVKNFQTRESITPVAGYFGPKTRVKANQIMSSQVQAFNQQAVQETGETPPSPTTSQPSDIITSLQNKILILQQQIASILKQLQSQQTASVAPISPTPSSIPAPISVPTPTPPEISVVTAIVDYVIDGDTVELRNKERVRPIGINTPEMGQPYSSEAKNKLKELIEGKEVKLEKDITERDQYNRLLRYIWLGDVLINLEMVKSGYANSYTYPPDVKYQDQIVAAEREAREKKIGLWVPAETSSCIIVSYMHADAAGNDNYNLNDEYVILKNTCPQEFNTTGWTAKDEATHIFTFPSFYFAPQSTVTLYSGSGTDTTDKLYWNRADERYAIWNNTGDTVYLRDVDGNLVLEYSY